MHTHSLGIRDEEMRFGYHSVWFSDHVLVTRKLGADSNELCLSGAEPVPNTCSEGGCQGFFTVFQDSFAKLCKSGAFRRLSAWR